RIGEYKQGKDPKTDEALSKIDNINKFLRQGLDESAPYEETIQQLMKVVR
ncbi:MAG TPA: EscN/YscN/HrcN family type III secretion system ATPase, partial [Opitutae bacterium]|nr:EscN/YscN/HrcN family type III secretion system ATPase [Opitutae bacterium]